MSTHPTTWTNALRPETRVKERRSNLPPALQWRFDGTPPPSRARPVNNDSRRSHLHSGTSHTPDMLFTQPINNGWVSKFSPINSSSQNEPFLYLLLLLKPSATQLLRLFDLPGLLNSLLLASSASGSIRQPVSASGRRRTSRKTQTSPCAGQRHQTSRSAGETSHDTARELEPSHALEEDDGNGESNANTGVALVWRGSQMKAHEHSFTVKPAFSVGSNLKPSAARKELKCPLVSTRERFKWCWNTMIKKLPGVASSAGNTFFPKGRGARFESQQLRGGD
ncbi:hypothetical protein YC2023_008580 [Brassica napus]